MRRLAMIALVLTTLTPAASLGQTEENRGSAGYLLQLCKTWLDSAEKEGDTVRNMGRTEPVRLAAAGVCMGFVVGVLETLPVDQAFLPAEGRKESANCPNSSERNRKAPRADARGFCCTRPCGHDEIVALPQEKRSSSEWVR